MQMKTSRQRRILELIEKNDIETQEELVSMLIADGYEVTQATISRDIRELGITKISVNGKVQKYVAINGSDSTMNNRLLGVFKTGFVSADEAGNLLIIKTAAGMAMAVAAAIDALRFEEVAGCIAGDDTIFCAIRNQKDVKLVKDKLIDMISK